MKNYVHITVYSPPSSRVSRSSPEPERKRMHLSQIPETEKVGVKQRSRKKGHKARLSRLLLSKECIPWSWHGLRWHKWGKRGGHSCGLITLMETLPFCQGLQKTFRNASSSRSEKKKHSHRSSPKEGEKELERNGAQALSAHFHAEWGGVLCLEVY